MLKLARLDDLRRRLTEALAHRPELARAFEEALVRHDEAALGDAFETLHQGPRHVRERVEAVILDWLFGDDGRIDVAQIASGGDSQTRH